MIPGIHAQRSRLRYGADFMPAYHIALEESGSTSNGGSAVAESSIARGIDLVLSWKLQ